MFCGEISWETAVQTTGGVSKDEWVGSRIKLALELGYRELLLPFSLQPDGGECPDLTRGSASSKAI